MHFIIFDLEATCWKDTFTDSPQEIIELGACMVNRYGENISSFNKTIKPTLNPVLSMYCKQLTGIQQREIDTSDSFINVTEKFFDWGEIHDNDYLLCCWGDKDIKFLEADCRRNQVDANWLNKNIDIKKQYNFLKLQNKMLSLTKALDKEGFEFDGNKHRALPDALNLAKIFIRYLEEWRY